MPGVYIGWKVGANPIESWPVPDEVLASLEAYRLAMTVLVESPAGSGNFVAQPKWPTIKAMFIDVLKQQFFGPALFNCPTQAIVNARAAEQAAAAATRRAIDDAQAGSLPAA